MRLKDVKRGSHCTVYKVHTADNAKIRKLVAFGIVHGASLSVLQRYPSIIVQIGYTQVALDQGIAEIIEVK